MPLAPSERLSVPLIVVFSLPAQGVVQPMVNPAPEQQQSSSSSAQSRFSIRKVETNSHLKDGSLDAIRNIQMHQQMPPQQQQQPPAGTYYQPQQQDEM